MGVYGRSSDNTVRSMWLQGDTDEETPRIPAGAGVSTLSPRCVGFLWAPPSPPTPHRRARTVQGQGVCVCEWLATEGALSGVGPALRPVPCALRPAVKQAGRRSSSYSFFSLF